MKLLLINPANAKRAELMMAKSFRFPPLGLGYIAALTPSDWEVTLIDENFEPFRYQEADLVGLTAFTCVAPRAYEIAGIYREHGIPTVIGGIHASMLPEEALGYVDTVVIGEAESVWYQVIADFMAGKMQHIYRGKWLDLTGVIQPHRGLFRREYAFGTIQASRGCPIDCEFCSVTAFNGRRYRQRPVDEVLNELETIPQKRVFFVDDNIIGYGKEAEKRAIALFKGIIERGIKKDWWCQASMNFADNPEVLEYAAKSGCRMVLIGIEAEGVDALKELGKKLNLEREYKEAFRRINHHKIAVLGAFMNGMDVDTPEKLRHRASYAVKTMGINAIQMTLLTPLPGTKLFSRLQKEGRLLYTSFPDDWRRYDLTEIVYKPALMTPEKLLALGREQVPYIYSYHSIWRKFFTTWRVTRSLITAIWAYRYNLAYRKITFQILKNEEIAYY